MLSTSEKNPIYTIGYSTRPIDEFIELLKIYHIQMVIDIRSIPKSRHCPDFNENALKQSLIPFPINKFTFKLRESSNVNLFIGNGITSNYATTTIDLTIID